jgi:hypothetical protein
METKSSNRQFTAKDIAPILMVIAFVVVNVYGKWPRLSWTLLVVAVLSVVFDHYSAMRDGVLKWKALLADRVVAKRAFPELQEFARRFEHFVNRQTNDTLHYIVESDILQGRSDLRATCQLPNQDIWIVMRQYFLERVERQSKTMKELKPALIEFQYLVASYTNFCVTPIFEPLPADVRRLITPPILAKLNLFQQQFRSFLEDFQLFAERLSESRPMLNGISHPFSMPKPMV